MSGCGTFLFGDLLPPGDLPPRYDVNPELFCNPLLTISV